ncbi:MAG: DegV family protein [Anaerolineales bacterium]|nr:DegV family protein [Anaerolineales bacterium]
MSIKIVTDSTCDLPEEVIQKLGITVIPLYINLFDKGYLDGVEITRQDFYTNLPNYEVHPTTSLPGITSFTLAYQTLASRGATEILSIHISKSLSSTIDVAYAAASEIETIPVTVRDSHQLSLGTGFQVELAARMANEGRSMEEILAALDELMPRTFVAAGLQTLEYLRRSGRMNAFVAGIGSLLQLKPILTMKHGQPASEQVRTTTRAEERLIQILEGFHPLERFALVHTHATKEAKAFLEKVAHLIPKGEMYSMDITPVIGVHIGPGAVGYAVVSKNPIA